MDVVHAALMSGPISVNSDGRYDSPGHSAMYGVYTVMENQSSKIIASEMIKVPSYLDIGEVCEGCNLHVGEYLVLLNDLILRASTPPFFSNIVHFNLQMFELINQLTFLERQKCIAHTCVRLLHFDLAESSSEGI